MLLCTWAGLLLKRVDVFEQLQLSVRQYSQSTCFLYVALKVVPWGSDPNFPNFPESAVAEPGTAGHKGGLQARILREQLKAMLNSRCSNQGIGQLGTPCSANLNGPIFYRVGDRQLMQLTQGVFYKLLFSKTHLWKAQQLHAGDSAVSALPRADRPCLQTLDNLRA